MKYIGILIDDVIVSKGINYTDYTADNEIELTREQYNSIPIPCKLIDGEFISCEMPEIEPTDTPTEPTEPTPQDDTDAMVVDHEYRITLLELGVNE